MSLSSQGKCFPCADSNCPLMGHSADRFTVTDGDSNTKYFLNTGSSKPFGREYRVLPFLAKSEDRLHSVVPLSFLLLGYSYKLTLTLDGPIWPNLGRMFVALAGDNDSTKEYKLHV